MPARRTATRPGGEPDAVQHGWPKVGQAMRARGLRKLAAAAWGGRRRRRRRRRAEPEVPPAADAPPPSRHTRAMPRAEPEVPPAACTSAVRRAAATAAFCRGPDGTAPVVQGGRAFGHGHRRPCDRRLFKVDCACELGGFWGHAVCSRRQLRLMPCARARVRLQRPARPSFRTVRIRRVFCRLLVLPAFSWPGRLRCLANLSACMRFQLARPAGAKRRL